MMTKSKRQTTLSDIEETISEQKREVDSQQQENLYDELELDDLFSQLRETIQPSEEPEAADEFTAIRRTVAKLPKLQDSKETLSGVYKETNEKEYLRSAKTDSVHKRGITQINDPILLRKKKAEEKTDSGAKWFNMPKGELTDSTKRDLKIIQQRAALDPKRHYKKGTWKIPEFFQVGTIVEGKTEFFSSRLKNKERHSTIMESVLHDQDTKNYFKRKYDEIQTKKMSGKKAHYKKRKEARKRF